MTDIIAKPFDWNDNLSKEALRNTERSAVLHLPKYRNGTCEAGIT